MKRTRARMSSGPSPPRPARPPLTPPGPGAPWARQDSEGWARFSFVSLTHSPSARLSSVQRLRLSTACYLLPQRSHSAGGDKQPEVISVRGYGGCGIICHPMHQLGKRSSERCSHLPKVTQPGTGEAQGPESKMLQVSATSHRRQKGGGRIGGWTSAHQGFRVLHAVASVFPSGGWGCVTDAPSDPWAEHSGFLGCQIRK